ncbi:MAG: protein-disulfide reductase DsbD domain-containing protein [Bacteroidota bacterium]
MTQKLFGICLALLLGASATMAQQSVVNWSYEAKQVSSNEYQVTFTANVQDGWYIYSQFLGDDGPVPTTFEFEGVEPVGKASEKGYKKEGYDEIFGMNLIKFGKTVTFSQKVKVSGGRKTISGYLTYMTCNDEQCLPPTDVEFEIVI